MFYSHDLLGRKSPLGAIWTMAHGKKLSKIKILGINVSDVCKHIMQPDVPHSLRLQGILIGGVVIVFNRQQLYLLEDLQDMLRKVTSAKAPKQSAAAVVKTVLQRGRDKARVEAITMEDTAPDMLLLPSHALDQFEDLDDLELLEPPARLGGRADPHEYFDKGEEDGTEAAGRRHGGHGGRRARDQRGKEEEVEDLLVLPSLAPPSLNKDGSRAGGTQRGGGASGRPSGTAGPSNQAPLAFNDDEVFEAPDLRVLLDDDDEGNAFVLAFGGLAAVTPAATPEAAAATPAQAAAAADGDRRRPGRSSAAGGSTSFMTLSPTEMGAPAAANAADGTAAAHTLDPLTEVLETEDSDLHFAVEMPHDLHFLSDLTQEDAEQQLCADGAEPLAATSEGQPAPSLVPLPSLGAPMEHFMPRSPLHDGEEVDLPAATAGVPRLSSRGVSTVATSTESLGRKRRRYSDEENDSASEATGSLRAMSGQQQDQLAAADDAEDANNNNDNDNIAACAQDWQQQPQTLRRQQKAPERPRRRRRAGGRVTLDSPEETLVTGRTYREWTLDSSALLKSSINAAPYPGGGGDPGRIPGLPGASEATASGSFAGRVHGRCFTSGPYDGTPGPMIYGAVAGMLAACHVDAASDAVRRGSAAMLNGRGMTWGRHLVRLVAMAAEADEVVDDIEEEEDASDRVNSIHGGPRRRAAVGGPDAGRVKRPCVVKRAAVDAATGSGARGNDAQQRQEQHPHQGMTAVEEEHQPQQPSGSLLQRNETSKGLADVDRGVLEQDLEASEVGGRFGGAFHAAEGAVGEAEDIMQDMEMAADEQMMQTEDDIEIERLRRQNTPGASDMERQLEAEHRAALGLSLGGLAGSSQGRPTEGKSSKATSESDTSSPGRETEDEVTGNFNYRRLSAAPKKRMFGTGALEDLLPAIDEVDVHLDDELLNFTDLGEQPQQQQGPSAAAVAAAATAAGATSNGSGRSKGTSGGASRKSSQQAGSGARGDPSSEGEAADADPLLSLKETNGLATQAPPPQLFMNRNTKMVISIFRKQLAQVKIQSRAQAAEQHQALPGGSGGGGGSNESEEPALSFFGLASRLKRSEAVKLFYQTLVTHTAGYVVASQDEPYGDITIRAAAKL